MVTFDRLEEYPSGSRGSPAKGVVWETVARVQIPSPPPLGNNTNPDDKLEFVLFFSNEYFGIKVDLNGKKKKLPGV